MPEHSTWQEFHEWGWLAAPTLWMETSIPLAKTQTWNTEKMAILEATVELEEKAQVGRNKLSIQRNQLYLQNRAKDAHRVLALENQCGAKNAQGLLSELLLQQKTLDHSENLPRGGNMSQYIPSEAQIWSLQGKGWTHPSWLKDWKPAVDPIDLDVPYWNARWEPCVEVRKKEGPEESQTSKVKGNIWGRCGGQT